MKPDFAQAGEHVDHDQKASHDEDRCNGARKLPERIRDRSHRVRMLICVGRRRSASFNGCTCIRLRCGALAPERSRFDPPGHAVALKGVEMFFTCWWPRQLKAIDSLLCTWS